MHLASLTRPELIFSDLQATDRPGVLRAFADRIAGLGLVRDADDLYQRLWEREQLGSTALGQGVAIPHCKIPKLKDEIVAIGLIPEGVDFGATDGEPARLFFLVVSPSELPGQHLQVLAAISRWLKSGRHGDSVLSLRTPEAISEFLRREGREGNG